jgi:hypothetical protein
VLTRSILIKVIPPLLFYIVAVVHPILLLANPQQPALDALPVSQELFFLFEDFVVAADHAASMGAQEF